MHGALAHVAAARLVAAVERPRNIRSGHDAL
jgi:hypothetical protein